MAAEKYSPSRHLHIIIAKGIINSNPNLNNTF